MGSWAQPVGKAAVAAVAAALTLLWLPTSAHAADGPGGPFTAKPVTASSVTQASKSASGQLAESDQSLLQRSDSASVNAVVKLDYDAAASYTGGITGLAPTSPSVTGRKLTGSSAEESAYAGYTQGIEATFRSALRARVPAATAGSALRTVYGGVAVRLPARDAKVVATLPGVAAVQTDKLEKPTTSFVAEAPTSPSAEQPMSPRLEPGTSSTAEAPTSASVQQPTSTGEAPEFVGSPALWRQLGGQAVAGKGVLVADIDTGVWPEHPLLAENPALDAPPPTPSGQQRPCVFGDNPLTPAPDVFQCNRKLIGGRPFLDTYNAVVGGDVYPDSARDSNGHGTHTTTTAAGAVLSSAPIFGSERGPVSGVAPGAWVLAYKALGAQGGFSSDLAAAVQQAVLDGAQVINYSISGGSSPYTDPVELAFLDAYNAGILVSAAAGNSGPGAGTTEHHSPWTLTVAASTQSRQFASTLTVTGPNGQATFEGATLTPGLTAPAPLLLAETIPGYDKLCSTELPPGAAAGKLVACQRGGIGRVQKGYNVGKGGAAGMVLYNLPLADVETDNHFLPTVHLADGTAFLAFLAANPGATASFPPGERRTGQGDVMAAFSARGPGGQALKPDVTAPGVQILAGHTPTPDEVAAGPPGQYFQAIAGTSMSAPVVTGSAILLKALHPDWRPGAVKSALLTTATTSVVKEDLKTPADPFDVGSGRVDLAKAGDAPLVFDETAASMRAIGSDPLTAGNLNLPTVNVPTMPGTVTVQRTARNVSGRAVTVTAHATSPTGSRIDVWPESGQVSPGQALTFTVRVSSSAPEGQYFGRVDLRPAQGPELHLPVAFRNRQGNVAVNQACAPASVSVGATTTCTVTAQNNSAADAAVVSRSTVSDGLRIDTATGAQVNRRGNEASAGPVILAAPVDATPAIAPGNTPAGGYLDLATLGVTPQSLGDETLATLDVPSFLFGAKPYTRLGVTSNGYLVVGGGSTEDVTYLPQQLPNPARPNGVLAPYWTDLDGTGSPGLRAATLTDGSRTWIVVQWDVHLFADTSPAGRRALQVWLGTNGTEDISFGYHPSALAPAPADPGLTVGAENVTGTKGAQIAGPPTSGYQVTSTPGAPGGTLTSALTLRGQRAGNETLTTTVQSDQVVGTTRVRTPIPVTR